MAKSRSRSKSPKSSRTRRLRKYTCKSQPKTKKGLTKEIKCYVEHLEKVTNKKVNRSKIEKLKNKSKDELEFGLQSLKYVLENAHKLKKSKSRKSRKSRK